MSASKEILISVALLLGMSWAIGLISMDDLKGSSFILWAFLTGILSGLAALEKGLGCLEKDVAEIKNALESR